MPEIIRGQYKKYKKFSFCGFCLSRILLYLHMLVRSLVRHRRDISTFLNCARFWTIQTRDGHAEADDAEVCGLMRICAYAEAIRKTKSVCAIVGKKTRSKIE